MAHIPDGFLSAPVAASTFVAAGAVTAYAAREARAALDDRAAPTLGLITAAVFAAQAVNFPVAGGTSGHLMGGTLVAVLLGPWAAFLAMTAVVVAQALIFADGGLTALGANVLNIAGVGSLLGYVVYRGLVGVTGMGGRRQALAAGIAAWLATVTTGTAAGLQLGLSGTVPTHLAVVAMAGVHAVIGVAEGGITAGAVWALAQKRPELLYRPRDTAVPTLAGKVVLLGLGVVAFAGGLLTLVASAAPDGLERVAIDLGFAETAEEWSSAPLGGYDIGLPGASGALVALLIGVLLLFAGGAAMARALATARRAREG
jgi:cobalt/nickel transport system permease protein